MYLLHTIGELCLNPVGLSAMTRLAPARATGQMMGVWFLASAIGNFMSGQVAGLYDRVLLPHLFGGVFAVTFLFTIVTLILARPIHRLMAGVR